MDKMMDRSFTAFPTLFMRQNIFNPLASKDNFSQHKAWCWENWTSQRHWPRKHKVMVGHLNPGSFAEYKGQIIPAPKG